MLEQYKFALVQYGHSPPGVINTFTDTSGKEIGIIIMLFDSFEQSLHIMYTNLQ
jgi:hypothetical protein